jgi:predicted metal-dependent phosphotriesterase family hydrolase
VQRLGDKKVRTVLGDIDPRELGKTDVHEHLLMHSPLMRGEELDDREKSTEEAVELRHTGIDALVELTTIGLGRDPRGMADIAAHSGLHIVLATGIHREAHYPPEHWVHSTATAELAELFLEPVLQS